MSEFVNRLRTQKRIRTGFIWVSIFLIVGGIALSARGMYATVLGYKEVEIADRVATKEACISGGRWHASFKSDTIHRYTYVVDGQSYVYQLCGYKDTLATTLWYNPHSPASVMTDPSLWLALGLPFIVVGLVLLLAFTALYWRIQRWRGRA